MLRRVRIIIYDKAISQTDDAWKSTYNNLRYLRSSKKMQMLKSGFPSLPAITYIRSSISSSAILRSKYLLCFTLLSSDTCKNEGKYSWKWVCAYQVGRGQCDQIWRNFAISAKNFKLFLQGLLVLEILFAIRQHFICLGQWLWHSWHNSRFRFQKTQVQIQSLATFYWTYLLLTVSIKDKNKGKEAGYGQFYTQIVLNGQILRKLSTLAFWSHWKGEKGWNLAHFFASQPSLHALRAQSLRLFTDCQNPSFDLLATTAKTPAAPKAAHLTHKSIPVLW